MIWNEFKENVEHWAEERGIYEHSTPEAQLLKALSELGELADAVIKNDRDGLKDAIGDVAVCLVNYAHMTGADELYLSESVRRMERRETVEVIGNICIRIGHLLSGERYVYIPQLIQNNVCEVARNEGLDFMSCCEVAWNEIKDRKGRMVTGGAFVKDN